MLFEVVASPNIGDYLQELDKRVPPKICFTRFIGYDNQDAFLLHLKQLYDSACQKGLFISASIANPTEPEVTQFYHTAQSSFIYDAQHVLADVRRWLAGIHLNKATALTQAIVEMMIFLQQEGAKENILKNAYVKFMCWCNVPFSKIVYTLGEQKLPKVLYVGNISKYEVYMLRILARAGCDVAYVNFVSDESYLKYDPTSRFSTPVHGRIKKEPSIDFTTLNLGALEQRNTLKQSLAAMDGVVEVNRWMQGDFFEAIGKTNTQRGSVTRQKICSLFVRYVGVDDKALYQNRLFELKNNLAKGQKPWLLFEEKIPNPSTEEVARMKKSNWQSNAQLIDTLTQAIRVVSDKDWNTLLQRAFMQVLQAQEDSNLTRLYNQAVHLLSWLERYAPTLLNGATPERTPIVVRYGNCNAREAEFLCLLAMAGMDVVILSPDKEGDSVFANNACAKESVPIFLENSMEPMPFPTKEVKVRVGTVAYQAERELDSMLYQGTGLFRERQFTRSRPVTLKTTYEEIELLWKEEAKYRPSFQAENGVVVVPNLFAKVCGVKDGNVSQYFDSIRRLLTPQTILFTQIPFLANYIPNPVKPYAGQFVSNGMILPEAIKRHESYRYDYLSEDIQDYILEKIQELMDLQWIDGYGKDVEEAIVASLLNLDKYTLSLIQGFDFTKVSPKMVVIDNNEAMLSLEDCILVGFLNLVGFDILVFTPTGYRNIEKYIKAEAFERYTIGELMFNITVPNLTKPKPNSGNPGFFGKIFGK